VTLRGSTGQLGGRVPDDALDSLPASQTSLEHHCLPSSSGHDQVARVFYLANVDTPQRLQETVNLVRSMTDRKVSPTSSLKAWAWRGTSGERRGPGGQWMDKPACAIEPAQATAETGNPAATRQCARILPAHAEPPQGPQKDQP